MAYSLLQEGQMYTPSLCPFVTGSTFCMTVPHLGQQQLDVTACPSVKGLLTAEPVMLRNGFFQPHVMVLSHGILRAAGEQGCFDTSFRITVDDRVISCLLHALHLLSVKVEETTAAILHCHWRSVKVHGGKAVCHTPHILRFVMGDGHRLSFLVLQQKFTLVSVAGESVLILLAQFWRSAIEKMKFHNLNTPFLFW